MRLMPAVITLILAASLIFATAAGASLSQDILGSVGDDPKEAQYPAGIEAYGVNASMSGPTTMSLNSYGSWEGRVVYDAAILNIPLPFRYDFTSAFYYPILPYITMNGGNVTLSRSVSGNGVFFESGNMYSWSPQKTKYATFWGKAFNRGWMNNYTRGTLGCCWSDTAWKYTKVD